MINPKPQLEELVINETTLDNLDFTEQNCEHGSLKKHWDSHNAEFLSLKDNYSLYKTLMNMEGQKNPQIQEKARRIAKVVRGFYDNKAGVLTNTLIDDYSTINKLIVSHNPESQFAETITTDKFYIRPTPLYNVLKEEKGLKFVQDLFGTQDSKEEIMSVMKYISQKDENSIYLLMNDINSSKRSFNERPSVIHLANDSTMMGANNDAKGTFLIYNTPHNLNIPELPTRNGSFGLRYK